MKTKKQNKMHKCSVIDFLRVVIWYAKTINFLRPHFVHFVVTIIVMTISSVPILVTCSYAEIINVNAEIKNLKSKDRIQKLSAIHKLGKIPDKKVRQELLSTLKTEKEMGMKVKIIYALANSRDISVLSEIESISRSITTHSDVRIAAVQSVSQLGGEMGVKTLAEIFNNEDEDIRVRITAGGELGLYLENEEAFTTLEKALNNVNPIIREQAVCSLGLAFGETKKKVIPLIEKMTYDNNKNVSDRAKKILDVLFPLN